MSNNEEARALLVPAPLGLVIDSFLNGQHKEMLRIYDEEYKFDSFAFVQNVQDCEPLNDKQKLTILGRVLKHEAEQKTAALAEVKLLKEKLTYHRPR